VRSYVQGARILTAITDGFARPNGSTHHEGRLMALRTVHGTGAAAIVRVETLPDVTSAGRAPEVAGVCLTR
jgi:hypothetical protein